MGEAHKVYGQSLKYAEQDLCVTSEMSAGCTTLKLLFTRHRYNFSRYRIPLPSFIVRCNMHHTTPLMFAAINFTALSVQVKSVRKAQQLLEMFAQGERKRKKQARIFFFSQTISTLVDLSKQALFTIPLEHVFCIPLRTPKTGMTLQARFGHSACDENIKGAHRSSLRQTRRRNAK